MTSATDLTDLKAKAKAATPGPWFSAKFHDENDCDVFTVVDNHGETLLNKNDQAITAYIAAANPQAILALIAERSADAAWMAEARRLLENAIRIAGTAAADMESAGKKQPQDSVGRDRCFASARTAKAIKAAIQREAAAFLAKSPQSETSK